MDHRRSNANLISKINKNLYRKYQVIREQTLASQRNRNDHTASITNYDDILDISVYKETNQDMILPWQYFTRSFHGLDLPVDD